MNKLNNLKVKLVTGILLSFAFALSCLCFLQTGHAFALSDSTLEPQTKNSVFMAIKRQDSLWF